jgi:hypothetical protein
MTRARSRFGALALAVALERAGGAAPESAKTTTEAACKDTSSTSASTSGPGTIDPFRAPAAKALELNAAGLAPYRQGKWEEARAQYRAAIAADPEFLAPRLNIASSFVRQERFAEATAEVVALLERAYVPWAREIIDAADLGALKVRPEMKEIERAMAAAAAKWGQGISDGLVFVARQRAPLRIPEGPGVFLLNPHQEVWAFSARTQRYWQLTAEDGHVVAMLPSSDGRFLIYVTAEKVVHGAKPGDVALRGVAVHQLTYSSMSISQPARVDGDVHHLGLHYPSMIVGLGEHEEERLTLSSTGELEPIEVRYRLEPAAVTLTGRGVTLATPERRFGGGIVARQTTRTDGAPGIEIGPPNGKRAPLKTGEGAGLGGLPIP